MTTGFVVAMVLAAIDVTDEDIVRDHCLSDVELESEYAKFRLERPAEAERLASVIAARDRTVFALLDAIRTEYGHARSYLRSAGVSEGALTRLADALIELPGIDRAGDGLVRR